jgi:type I restriction enzyme R subunit
VSQSFTESVVEEAALAWLESVGWQVRNGAEIAPGEPAAERDDYGQVVLAQRLRDALARLNPALPAEAVDDAFRKLTRPEGAELIVRNRALHRLLVDGVTVEYRDAEGSIRGAQARVIDFDDPANNDWLAVNQFSVVENKHSRRPDVVLCVNGVPLAVVELKNAADENATIWSAFQQLHTYKAEVPCGKDRCVRAVRELSQAFALAVPHAEALRIRDDVTFFQAVQAVLAKRAPGDARPRRTSTTRSGRSSRGPWHPRA